MCFNISMDTHLTETLQTDSSPSDTVDFRQSLNGSSSPSSPTQTLEDKGQSISVDLLANIDNSSNVEYLLAGDHSDSAFDIEPQEDERDEDDTLLSSPIHTKPLALESDCFEWPSANETYEPLTLNRTESCPPNRGIETESRPSDSFPPVWIAEDKPSLVGAGLANLGNTCFFNSVLQCFTHTVPLVQGLLSCKHAMPCDGNIEGLCVLCALHNHIELSLASTGRVVSPWKLVDNLSYFSSSFRRFQQEDAHEFLQCFLDKLDSCFNELKKNDNNLSLKDDNVVKQVFGGRLISKLRCCNCGHCSDTCEPLIDLSLEIKDVGTLPAALESFTKIEKIEDPDTKFTCEKCKEEVSVEKQLMLDQLPSVAAFHLKRFKNDGSYVERIDKFIEFPLELDLLPYISGNQSNNVEVKYDLYAVVVHIGVSSTFGHYYCFIRPSPGTWYKFEDSKVIRVREEFVLSQKAYILFYAKRGTPWFSSFMETHKSSINPNILSTSPKSVLDNMDHICTSSHSAANNHSCDVNETSTAADRICTVSSEGSIPEKLEVREGKDDLCTMHTQVPLGAVTSHGSSCKVEQMFPPSVLKEKNCNQELGGVEGKANVSPQMPPRSPSPEIYNEEPPEERFYIMRGHLKSVDQVPCKRKLNKDLDDSERKEACRLIKNMPGSRGTKLMAALRGFSSENSVNKKSRRMEASPNRDKISTSARRKPNLNYALRPLAAGSIR